MKTLFLIYIMLTINVLLISKMVGGKYIIEEDGNLDDEDDLTQHDLDLFVKKLSKFLKESKNSREQQQLSSNEYNAAVESNSIEDISLIQLKSIRGNQSVPIESFNPNRGKLNRTFGSDKCNFRDHKHTDGEVNQHRFVPICPWRYEVRYRDDMKPSTRAIAVCNCPYCRVTTKHMFSTCRQLMTYMPAFVRTIDLFDNVKWKYVLEEVPTSCVCGESY